MTRPSCGSNNPCGPSRGGHIVCRPPSDGASSFGAKRDARGKRAAVFTAEVATSMPHAPVNSRLVECGLLSAATPLQPAVVPPLHALAPIWALSHQVKSTSPKVGQFPPRRAARALLVRKAPRRNRLSSPSTPPTPKYRLVSAECAPLESCRSIGFDQNSTEFHSTQGPTHEFLHTIQPGCCIQACSSAHGVRQLSAWRHHPWQLRRPRVWHRNHLCAGCGEVARIVSRNLQQGSSTKASS